MKTTTFIVTRTIFTAPLQWRAANELVTRGKARVINRVRHWVWEWMAIEVLDDPNTREWRKGTPIKVDI